VYVHVVSTPTTTNTSPLSFRNRPSRIRPTRALGSALSHSSHSLRSHTQNKTTSSSENYIFRGQSRLLCSLGKEISKIGTDPKHGGWDRTRFPRKSCKPAASCGADLACTKCAKHADGSSIKKTWCHRTLQTHGVCDETEPWTEAKIVDSRRVATFLKWQIPLWSCNVFPTICVEAVRTMERLKKLSESAFTRDSPEQVAKAVSVVVDFKQWMKTPSNGIAIIDNWNEAFRVRRKTVADATCPKFRPEDGTTCTKDDYKALLPGKVYRLMDNFAEKLTAWGDLATANVKKYTDELTFTEKIDCKHVCVCVCVCLCVCGVLLHQPPLFDCLVSRSHLVHFSKLMSLRRNYPHSRPFSSTPLSYTIQYNTPHHIHTHHTHRDRHRDVWKLFRVDKGGVRGSSQRRWRVGRWLLHARRKPGALMRRTALLYW